MRQSNFTSKACAKTVSLSPNHPQALSTSKSRLSTSHLKICTIDLDQRPHQNIRPVLDVLRAREFLWSVADAADTRNEDHADGREARHVLRIVTGAAGHLLRG